MARHFLFYLHDFVKSCKAVAMEYQLDFDLLIFVLKIISLDSSRWWVEREVCEHRRR